MRCVGYIRVSTESQGDSGGGLAAQRDAIRREVERRGWQLVDVVEDVASGGMPLPERPGGRRVLELLGSGAADVVMVAKLCRLTRSSAELGALLEALGSGRLPGVANGGTPRGTRRAARWALVSCDVAVDMTTPAGELVATMLGAANRLERRMIGARTSEALRAKQAAGLQLGRRLDMPADVRTLVLHLYGADPSPSRVARELNARGVPTARGGATWRPSNVQRVVEQATRTTQPVRPMT